VRRRFEPPVFDRLPALAVARGKQFRRRTVIEFAHDISPNKKAEGTI
jgi:hypothetical protein